MTLPNNKIPDSIIDAQVERLLDVVQTYHKEYCDTVNTKAHQDARAIIKQAHHEARRRMHQVVIDNREKIQQEIGAAKAKQQTEDKQHQYRRDQRLLKMALDKLQQLLISRWQITEQRQAWIDNISGLASRMLLTDTWQVEHPAEWPVTEQKQLRERITKQTGQPPTLIVSQDIQAGIRISANGSVVDGALSGLLVDRYRIEAEFLSHYRTQCSELQQPDKEKDNTSE